MDTIVLQQSTEYIENTAANVIDYLPVIVGALLILLVGWIVGRLVGSLIKRIVDRSRLDSMVMNTPLGGPLGGSESAVSRTLGMVGSWFVYALAILAAADALQITLLSEWLSEAVSYLPALVAGILIIVVGFVLADFLADVVAQTETVTDTGYTGMFADGLRFFLYFVATVIGLGTMGVDVQILNTFARAAAYGLAAGIALAIGISFGLGGRDHVAANISNWLPGKEAAGTPTRLGQTDGGEDTDEGV